MPMILLATRNQGKVKEIQQLLAGRDVTLIGINDVSDFPDIVEDGETFYDNALKKAKVACEYTGMPVIADDSGLEVDALNGMPGVYSARFAGENGTDEMNNMKLLDLLKDVPCNERTARFRCVAVFCSPDGILHVGEGTCEGLIGKEPVGSKGFGYDPLFVVPEYGKTFAELGEDVKNTMSHRAKAFKDLLRKMYPDD